MAFKNNIFNQALKQKSNLEIPLWELEFHLWDKFGFGKLQLGHDLKSLSIRNQNLAMHKNAEIFFEVSKKIGFSAITIPGNYWELAPGEPAYYWVPEKLYYKQAEIIHQVLAEEFGLVANVGGILAMPSAENYLDFSISMLESPEEIDKLADSLFRDSIEKINKLSDIGYNIFLTASDLADNHGPFFPPNEFQRFILPYLVKWAEFINKKDSYSIFHSDGNLNLYLDDIIGSGINALQAIDPIAGMNMEDVLLKSNNKITLCGNIDCGILLTKDEKYIRKETMSLLEQCYGKGEMVLGASNAVQAEINLSNYLALAEALNEFNNKI